MGTEVLRPQDCLIRPAPFRRPNTNPRSKKRREGSPRKKAQPVMGHVTILKRGEPLPTKAKEEEEEEVRSEPAVSDQPLFGADPLGPSPVLVPKQIRLVPGRVGDVYAGSAFATSPSPRKVPLPSFSRREWDLSATKDLRRILRLD